MLFFLKGEDREFKPSYKDSPRRSFSFPPVSVDFFPSPSVGGPVSKRPSIAQLLLLSSSDHMVHVRARLLLAACGIAGVAHAFLSPSLGLNFHSSGLSRRWVAPIGAAVSGDGMGDVAEAAAAAAAAAEAAASSSSSMRRREMRAVKISLPEDW